MAGKLFIAGRRALLPRILYQRSVPSPPRQHSQQHPPAGGGGGRASVSACTQTPCSASGCIRSPTTPQIVRLLLTVRCSRQFNFFQDVHSTIGGRQLSVAMFKLSQGVLYACLRATLQTLSSDTATARRAPGLTYRAALRRRATALHTSAISALRGRQRSKGRLCISWTVAKLGPAWRSVDMKSGFALLCTQRHSTPPARLPGMERKEYRCRRRQDTATEEHKPGGRRSGRAAALDAALLPVLPL